MATTNWHRNVSKSGKNDLDALKMGTETQHYFRLSCHITAIFSLQEAIFIRSCNTTNIRKKHLKQQLEKGIRMPQIAFEYIGLFNIPKDSMRYYCVYIYTVSQKRH